MVGQQLARSNQRLNRIVEAFQLCHIAYVSRFVTELTVHLRQRGRAQRVVSFTQVDKQQGVIVGRQLRRNGMTHIVNTRKSGNHQRQRRRHFTLLIAFLPAGFHRH
ncbi:hypothetical protein D3C78_779190 [compost metagenome]